MRETHAHHATIGSRNRVFTKSIVKPVPPTLPLASAFVIFTILDAQRTLPLARLLRQPILNHIEMDHLCFRVEFGGGHCHTRAQPLPGVKLNWVNFFLGLKLSVQYYSIQTKGIE